MAQPGSTGIRRLYEKKMKRHYTNYFIYTHYTIKPIRPIHTALSDADQQQNGF